MLTLLLVGVVSASYPMFHYDEQRTGYVPGDGPQTDTIFWVAETGEWADGSPAVHNGKVFVPTWTDMNFADVNPMGLVCCDATTGAEIWTNELGGPGVGSVSGVAIADGQVYLGGTDGRLYCIDEETGETLWESARIDMTSIFGLSSSPLVYDGVIYALSASDGVLHAFTPEGIESWSFPTGGTVGNFTSPAAADGKVFVAGNESNLFCIDTVTQTDTWDVSLPTSVKSTPVVSDGKVYVTTAEGLHALDASTGDEIWNASLGGTFSTPVVAGETIIAGSSDGLHAYDGGTGNPLWNFSSASIDVSPVVAGSLVYAATNEKTGTLYAVDVGTGEEVWSYTLDTPDAGTHAAFFASSPAVSNGVLYIGAENNRFYAFRDGEATEPAFVRWSRTVQLT
ncbi:MAG: PQQ-like beta-propeller repeat protein, partial [Methanomicrobiales archaeon]|nr:PQQ-like beta-propeller repeat protein [Methanomicrobiales archaeon]